jgi:hypothetical protein
MMVTIVIVILYESMGLEGEDRSGDDDDGRQKRKRLDLIKRGGVRSVTDVTPRSSRVLLRTGTRPGTLARTGWLTFIHWGWGT